jgi:hypothetical protein
MKRNFVQNGLLASAIIFGATGLFMSAAQAQTAGSFDIGGEVTTTLTLGLTADAGAESLTLDGTAAGEPQIVQVATLDSHTNNNLGYTLSATITSMTKDGGDPIHFQVTTGTATPAVGAFNATVSAVEGAEIANLHSTNTANAAGGDLRNLYILYTPDELQDPGDYVGTIALTVQDNQ